MTRDEVRRLLRSYKDQVSRVHMREVIYERMRREYDLLKGTDYGSVRVQSSDCTSEQERFILRYETARERYEEEAQKLYEIDDKIAELCEVLDGADREFIVDAYMSQTPTYRVQCKHELSYEGYKKRCQRIIKRLARSQS